MRSQWGQILLGKLRYMVGEQEYLPEHGLSRGACSWAGLQGAEQRTGAEAQETASDAQGERWHAGSPGQPSGGKGKLLALLKSRERDVYREEGVTAGKGKRWFPSLKKKKGKDNLTLHKLIFLAFNFYEPLFLLSIWSYSAIWYNENKVATMTLAILYRFWQNLNPNG